MLSQSKSIQNRTRFNPRPRAGAMYRVWRQRDTQQRFNPRPRAGAMLQRLRLGSPETVSIRAPVRGRCCSCLGVPVRGRCRPVRALLPEIDGFNPRPRAGAMEENVYISAIQVVSIRAPVRGR